MNAPELTTDAVFRHILSCLEKSLGYYDKPGIRITYLNSVYESDNFNESLLKIECPIFVNNRELGEIEVFYPGLNRYEKEYLLKMENDLINAVAERIGNYIKSKEVIDELKSANDELRKLSSHLQSVRESERKKVASTIHDEFGQKLLSLKYEILNIRKDIAGGSGNYESHIEGMLGLVEASIKTVRDISSNLRPGILDKLGIAAAIQWLAKDMETRTGIKFNVICTPEDMILNDDYTTALFRIFQEAATNIIRHSGANEVIINLKAGINTVLLIILDNGKGIREEDLFRADSFGIKGMRERVLSFQGTFSIMNNDGEGTVIKVSLPLNGMKAF
jgi:signal transduction histidine kinase